VLGNKLKCVESTDFFVYLRVSDDRSKINNDANIVRGKDEP